MTAEKYSRIEHATPYIFELKAGDKELYYFGSPHISDPNNPLFAEIETAFNKANPDIVFVEGINVRGDKTKFNERVKSVTREEAIEHMGESGLTLKLGVFSGVRHPKLFCYTIIMKNITTIIVSLVVYVFILIISRSNPDPTLEGLTSRLWVLPVYFVVVPIIFGIV